MCKRDGEGSVYTNKALRDMILNFIIAGRDTTAVTLSWFFYMMICHPEVAHKIVEELETVTKRPAQHTGGRQLGPLQLISRDRFDIRSSSLTVELGCLGI
jgi:cytochrome P450